MSDTNFNPNLFTPEERKDVNNIETTGTRLLKGFENQVFYNDFVNLINRFPKQVTDRVKSVTPIENHMTDGFGRGHFNYDDEGKIDARLKVGVGKNKLSDTQVLGHELGHVDFIDNYNSTKGIKSPDARVENLDKIPVDKRKRASDLDLYNKEELAVTIMSDKLINNTTIDADTARIMAYKIVNSLTNEETVTLLNEYVTEYDRNRTKSTGKPHSYFEPKFWRQGK